MVAKPLCPLYKYIIKPLDRAYYPELKYVVACNHLLRKEGRDNPTIGLLICKEKDRIQAQYALESSSQPIAISEYDLEKFYPEKLEGTMPTIEEWEAKLGGSIEHE